MKKTAKIINKHKNMPLVAVIRAHYGNFGRIFQQTISKD